jgi:hypothetical protein
MENEQKEVKAISYTWWIAMIIGIIIGLTNSDSRYVDSQPIAEAFKWGLMGALFGSLLGYIIDQTRKSTVVQNISKTIENQKMDKELRSGVQNSMKNYQNSSHHFQFLSDETLLSKYQKNQSNMLTEMDRLALEEELVKRGLIKFSPTHEKIEKISELFEDASSQDEIQRTKEFIASRLGCEADNVKTAYLNKLREMGYESSDLDESEIGFGNRAKEEAEQLGMRVENTPSSLILKWSREFIENNK